MRSLTLGLVPPLNVGMIKGGAGANIVQDHAEAVVDVRFWDNDEYADVDARIRAMAEAPFIDGVEVTVDREAHKPSMMPSEQTEVLMALIEESGDELGIDITWQEVGGWIGCQPDCRIGYSYPRRPWPSRCWLPQCR